MGDGWTSNTEMYIAPMQVEDGLHMYGAVPGDGPRELPSAIDLDGQALVCGCVSIQRPVQYVYRPMHAYATRRRNYRV